MEQYPHHTSCSRCRREKSHCQEERGSLSVSSAVHERWIYHGFPFLPCFIWQFIILSAGTGQLPRHTPSLADPCWSHAQDPGKMHTWTTSRPHLIWQTTVPQGWGTGRSPIWGHLLHAGCAVPSLHHAGKGIPKPRWSSKGRLHCCSFGGFFR